ncbi:MAG TPA: hypothetical protein VEO74_07480, partial [Thermoanaerobaculia bacterium]|nr:hypothetical protein [Thermoanaerobaculia bacterium]
VRGALDEFRRLAALHPKEAQHHRELAVALLTGGLGEAAREEARRAVAIEPNSARAHYSYAIALEHDLLGRGLHTGFDLAGARAEIRKAKELDGTDLTRRVELAEVLLLGDDGIHFSRGNRLAEAIDEYKGILKDFGAEAKGYEQRLMLLYAHAGRWEELKKLIETMPDGEQKSMGRILAAAATSGVPAATRELDSYGGDTRRTYAAGVGQTLMALGRYPEAAAMFEIAARGSKNASQIDVLANALRKARRGGNDNDTPAGAVATLLRAFVQGNEADIKKVVPPGEEVDLRKIGFNPRAIPMNGMTPEVIADLMLALSDSQVDGSDALGYRVRWRLFAGEQRMSMNLFVQGEAKKYVVAAVEGHSVGEAVLKLVDAGKLDAARTWLNWAREDISAGGGDDPLSGPPFAALWPKDKASATADEIRLAAAALASGADAKKETLAALLAVREKAADDQKKWINVALIAAYKEPAKFVDVAERLFKSYPDSKTAFSAWTLALLRSGKADAAEAAAKQRLERSPRNREALVMLTDVAASRNDYTAAAAYAKRIVDELTPTDGDYNISAWIALFSGKNIDKGIEDAQRATTAAGRGTSAALHTLAALYAESGKNLEAKQALVQSIEKRMTDTPSPSDWYVVGRIAENYGVPEAAVAAYKRVEKTNVDGLSTWELSQRRLAAINVK